MSKDLELINELKNGNSKRVSFFKEKIKEELAKEGSQSNDEIISRILETAINSYNEDVKIPFLFHLKSIIKNSKHENNTGIFSKNQYDIINLYLKKENERYLSKGEIAERLNVTIDDVLNTIKILDNDDKKIEEVFKGYRKKLEDREHFFTVKNTHLSLEQASLLAEYCGVFGEELTINGLAKKKNKSYDEIKHELTKAFRLLNVNDNLKTIVKRYPNIKDKLFKKSIAFNIRLNKEKLDHKVNTMLPRDFSRSYYLNKEDITMLELLESYRKNEITKEMILNAGFSSIQEFIEKRQLFFYKVGRSLNIKNDIKTLYKDLNITELLNKPRLTRKEYETLLIIAYDDKNTNDTLTLRNNKNKVLKKIEENKELLEKILLILPDLDTTKLTRKNQSGLPAEYIEFLSVLDKNMDLEDDELAKMLGFDDVSKFKEKKYRLLRKVKDNDYYLEEAKSLFPNIIEELNSEKNRLRAKYVELLELLRDNKDKPLSSSIMASKLGFASEGSYRSSKTHLFNRIKTNEELKRQALQIYPELIIEQKVTGMAVTFTNMEVNFLQEFCLIKNNNLIYQSENDIASKLKLSKDSVNVARASSTAKVIKNMIVGNNLEILLWPNFLNEFMTRDNFDIEKSIDIEEELLNNIDCKDTKTTLLKGIKNLEESIFKDYVSTINDEFKAMLALRLGYFNKRFFSSSEVADIFDVDEEVVIRITKDCLRSSQDVYIDSKKNLEIIKH